jgi:hypothetical protein
LNPPFLILSTAKRALPTRNRSSGFWHVVQEREHPAMRHSVAGKNQHLSKKNGFQLAQKPDLAYPLFIKQISNKLLVTHFNTNQQQ